MKAAGLAVPGSAVLGTLVGSSVRTVYLMPHESGSCQTDAVEPSASKPASLKQKLKNSRQQNLRQPVAYWPHTAEPANTELQQSTVISKPK